MQLPQNTSVIPVRDTTKEITAGSPGYLIDENVVTRTSGSYLTSAWVNDVSDEIKAVIVAANLTLNGAVKTQLRDAINILINASVAGGGIAPGTRMAFFQQQAPVGWTIDTTKDNMMVRIVGTNNGTLGSGGTGGYAFGGVHSPILMDVVPSHTHTLTGTGTTDTVANHVHADTFSAAIGAGGIHNHNDNLAVTVANDTHSHSYQDVFHSESLGGASGSTAPHKVVPGNMGTGSTDFDNQGYYLNSTTTTDTHSHVATVTGGVLDSTSHTHTVTINGGIQPGGTHMHNVTISGNASLNTGTNWQPKYLNAILATKN